jgi:hypothetical protein
MASREVLLELNEVIQEYKQWRGLKKYVGFTPIQFKEAIFNKHADLAESAPTLFNKAVDGDFEKPVECERLQYLMNMVGLVNSDASNYDDISKQVNHKFSTEFGVYDVVDKLEKKRLAEEAASSNSNSKR